MDTKALKIDTLIEHKASHRVAKITDIYHPPDNPFVISLTYKYIDTDKVRTIIDSTLESFGEHWDILDMKSKEVEPNPV